MLAGKQCHSIEKAAGAAGDAATEAGVILSDDICYSNHAVVYVIEGLQSQRRVDTTHLLNFLCRCEEEGEQLHSKLPLMAALETGLDLGEGLQEVESPSQRLLDWASASLSERIL